MSGRIEQGPQNVAQAEASAEYEALKQEAWGVWDNASGPLPAAYASWCAAEIELATAALREERDSFGLTLDRTGLALDAALKRAEAAEAEVAAIKQAISDPENQPSQFGTVPVAMLQAANRRADSAEAEVERVCNLLEAKPYTPRVGDVVTVVRHDPVHHRPPGEREARLPVGIVKRVRGFDYLDGVQRYLLDDNGGWVVFANEIRPSTPAERAAAGLAPEAPAQPQQPQVLPEHLAYIEASASAWIDLSCASEQATRAAHAILAAVARRDGGAK